MLNKKNDLILFQECMKKVQKNHPGYTSKPQVLRVLMRSYLEDPREIASQARLIFKLMWAELAPLMEETAKAVIRTSADTKKTRELVEDIEARQVGREKKEDR